MHFNEISGPIMANGCPDAHFHYTVLTRLTWAPESTSTLTNLSTPWQVTRSRKWSCGSPPTKRTANSSSYSGAPSSSMRCSYRV